MNLSKRAIGLLTALLVLFANIAVFAQTISEPRTTLSLEPRRTASGMDYDLYIENSDYLSTLFFEINFDVQDTGSVILEKNECFDLVHSEWSGGSVISVKGYLGRTGDKLGFSSDERIKVAKITIPLNVSEVGELHASISKASCAGITETDGNAIKGNVTIPERNINYTIRECSILNCSKEEIHILSAANQSADVIFAAYDKNGSLINIHKENAKLLQGENKLDVSGIDFSNSESISVMIWDSIASMRSLADKATLNK